MVVSNARLLTNWTSYLVAAYFAKDWDTSLEIWDSIVEILGDDPRSMCKVNELNEIFLFRVKIFVGREDYKKGIKFIIKNKKYIVDDYRRNEALVDLYMRAGQTRKAVECLEELLKLNSCNSKYYKQILHAEGVEEDQEKIRETLAKYEEVLPKSNTHTRLAIELLDASPEWEEKLAQYMRPMIIKGVPSLINEMRSLYNDPAKTKMLGNVLLAMCKSMEAEMTLAPSDD